MSRVKNEIKVDEYEHETSPGSSIAHSLHQWVECGQITGAQIPVTAQ